jgi:hypothetical protein
MTAHSMTKFSLAALTAFVLGCTGADEATPSVQTNPVSASGSDYLLTEQPEDTKTVIEARETAQDSDEVAVLGRIGGSANPWIEGRAAFSIVDPTLKACSDIPGDACPKPWDYCCEVPSLPGATALIKVVDAEGNVVKADAKEMLNLKELDTVVARGTAQRDDAGNLTVLATGIYVQK